MSGSSPSPSEYAAGDRICVVQWGEIRADDLTDGLRLEADFRPDGSRGVAGSSPSPSRSSRGVIGPTVAAQAGDARTDGVLCSEVRDRYADMKVYYPTEKKDGTTGSFLQSGDARFQRMARRSSLSCESR